MSVASVFSSQWCRCLETARLLGLGPVTQQPVLNSFFRNYERREPQTRMLREWIARQKLNAPLILVTHQVNITALTGVYPQSGELVILRRDMGGELSVAGTIRTE
jgi:broad specificity phosphatase PhoE